MVPEGDPSLLSHAAGCGHWFQYDGQLANKAQQKITSQQVQEGGEEQSIENILDTL